ncbi:DNA mismatch repair endonuclease MutL [Thermodesulfobacteriota bacterium]
MSNIRILPEKVANQIAAGEVIERPASVVRELLDNSIDSGADKIDVKIEKGGKRLIRVSDNGFGMNKDDMILALERHATSKISTVSELFSINTLGFRGEALPSIWSVSRIEITSRPADQLAGYRLKASGGELKSIDETGAPAGTTVEVMDLFFNTPARRKFLRADKTEMAHIIDTLTRIALPFTHIQIRLDDTAKTLLNLPASENELSRLSALLGRDVAVSLIDTYKETDGLKIRAYLAPPDFSRTRGDRLYIYVNKRSIRDKLVTRSIMEGYGQRLMKGRYPQAVIFMEIDPTLVDVNVHPAKQEVRFHQGRLIFQTLSSTIENALRDQFRPFSDTGYREADDLKGKQFSQISMAEPVWEYSEEEQKGTSQTVIETRKEYQVKEVPQILGQLRDTYLLFQTIDGLLLVDQHAAHERIVYETLKKSYQSSRIESQAFLIPHRLELSLKESRVVMEKLDQLTGLGFELDHFGGNTFLLRSVPSILVDIEWDNFLRDLIPVLEDERDLSNEKALDRLLILMSCHGAIRAGQRMSHREITLLLEELERMELPTNCPHGRPIFLKFSYHEIEKMFKRVV